jgi:hypothetical protein
MYNLRIFLPAIATGGPTLILKQPNTGSIVRHLNSGSHPVS